MGHSFIIRFIRELLGIRLLPCEATTRGGGPPDGGGDEGQCSSSLHKTVDADEERGEGFGAGELRRRRSGEPPSPSARSSEPRLDLAALLLLHSALSPLLRLVSLPLLPLHSAPSPLLRLASLPPDVLAASSPATQFSSVGKER